MRTVDTARAAKVIPVARGLVRCGIVLLAAALLPCAVARDARAGVGAWTTGGPEAGLVVALAVDPLTSGVVYAGAQFGGVFKTATGGSFWTRVDNGLTTLQIQALAVDPRSPGTAYAGTFNGGLFKTTNGGTSWAAANNGLAFTGFDAIYAIAIDSQTPATLYASTASGGIFKSTDGGGSWTRSFTAGSAVRRLTIDPVTPTTVYAATSGGGVFKTVNGGVSWSAINNGLSDLDVEALAVDPKTPAIVYVATFGGGAFKSLNGGASWSAINSGLPSMFLEAFALDPQTPLTLYAGTSTVGVFKSTNGGGSWFPANTGLPPNSNVLIVAVDPRAPATLYAAMYGNGVYKSTNGGSSWSASNASLLASAILSIAPDPQNPATLYSGTRRGGAIKSTNGGASWRPSSSGITDRTVNAIAVNPQTPSILYAGTSRLTPFQRSVGSPPAPGSGGVFKSTNGGASWASSLSLDVAVLALAVDPVNPLTVYAGTFGNGVYKSTNGGTNWAQVNAGLADEVVFSLAIHLASPGTVYAGTWDFDGTGDGRVFKTTNGGGAWSATGLTSVNPVVALAFNPQAPSTLYAATWGDGVFKTVNAGTGWSRINVGLFNQAGSAITVFALGVDPQSPSTVYAGSFDNGVFRSTNSGESWTRHNVGLPDDSGVHALAINAAGTCLHAGTGGSVYDFATQVSAECPAPPTLAAAFSSTKQSLAVGATAQLFATVQNLSGTAAADVANAELVPVTGENCGITQLTGAQTPFAFQAVNAVTNQPVADVNKPVDIGPGGSQTFSMTLTTPADPLCALDLQFGINCSNTPLADIITGVNTLLLSTGGTASCGMSGSVSASQATFNVGQTLVAGGSVTNPGLPGTAADFYVGVLRPDNSIQFITPTGIVMGNVNDVGSFRPLGTNVPLATPFSESQPTVFTHQRTADDLRGRYVFFMLVMKTGTLTGGGGPDAILRLATAPYSFP